MLLGVSFPSGCPSGEAAELLRPVLIEHSVWCGQRSLVPARPPRWPGSGAAPLGCLVGVLGGPLPCHGAGSGELWQLKEASVPVTCGSDQAVDRSFISAWSENGKQEVDADAAARALAPWAYVCGCWCLLCSLFSGGSGRQQQPVLLPPWVHPFHSTQLGVPWRVPGSQAKPHMVLMRYQFPGRV